MDETKLRDNFSHQLVRQISVELEVQVVCVDIVQALEESSVAVLRVRQFMRSGSSGQKNTVTSKANTKSKPMVLKLDHQQL